jgi:hypothetical protein
MPRSVCGPAAKVELEFWGIPDTIIERCCYSHYNAFNSTLKALNRLEKDRHGYPEESHDKKCDKMAQISKTYFPNSQPPRHIHFCKGK